MATIENIPLGQTPSGNFSASKIRHSQKNKQRRVVEKTVNIKKFPLEIKPREFIDFYFESYVCI
jgi:hypothetical protein